MRTRITLIRAVGSEFLSRKFRSIILVFTISALVIVIIAAWLTTLNPWWWLLAAPLMLLVVAGIIALLLLRLFLQIFRPTLSDQQQTSTARFVDKLERVTENLQTPMPIIVYRVVRDIIRPGEKTFIKSAASDSTSLHKDLIELGRMFK